MKLKAVCFDIDGTLYPNASMYFRSIPLFLGNRRLFMAFGKARSMLRKKRPIHDFRAEQAALCAGILKDDVSRVSGRIDRVIYGRWQESLEGMALFPGVQECMEKIRARGLKIGLLSDFPVEGKLKVLRLDFAPDAAFSTEDLGYLKPNIEGFSAMIQALSCKPGEILFVGNSHAYDVKGAAAAGMRTALIGRSKGKKPEPDLVFRNYEVLYDFVIKNA